MSGRNLTPKSVAFRRRAAVAADKALVEADTAQMLKLLDEALSWIGLAENEELLDEAAPNDRHVVEPRLS